MELTFIQLVLNILVMLTFIPIGYFLAWLCKDEIIYRKWMFVIFYSLVFVFLVFFLLRSNLNILLTLIYMILVTSVSIFKSRDKKFLKN